MDPVVDKRSPMGCGGGNKRKECAVRVQKGPVMDFIQVICSSSTTFCRTFGDAQEVRLFNTP